MYKDPNESMCILNTKTVCSCMFSEVAAMLQTQLSMGWQESQLHSGGHHLHGHAASCCRKQTFYHNNRAGVLNSRGYLTKHIPWFVYREGSAHPKVVCQSRRLAAFAAAQRKVLTASKAMSHDVQALLFHAKDQLPVITINNSLH